VIDCSGIPTWTSH